MSWRRVTRVLLAVNALIALVTAFNYVPFCFHFPAWFTPVFLMALGVLIAITLRYVYELDGSKDALRPQSNGSTTMAWVLLVASVVCTSALHKFYPFRPRIVEYWPRTSPILRYNFVLTVGSLFAVIVLALLYRARCRRTAVVGLIVLAAWMIVPNDACENPFNRPWVEWIGASPLMFMPNSVVLLVGVCCLHGLRPRVSAVVMTLINGGVLLLGIGHLTGVVW